MLTKVQGGEKDEGRGDGEKAIKIHFRSLGRDKRGISQNDEEVENKP